jgi:PAS domain S-box-containing protein
MCSESETRSPRTALGDLAALSAVAATWVGKEPHAIAAGLADVLVRLFRIDFALVRLFDLPGGSPVEVTRGTAGGAIPQWLQRHLTVELPSQAIICDIHEAEGAGGALVIPIGAEADCGLLAAACHRTGFPSEIDRVLLSVAGNHAMAALRAARFIEDHRRAKEAATRNEIHLGKARDELEAKLAQQIADLRRSEAHLAEAQRMAHVGWWERDLITNRVSLSDEVCRIFGVQPVDLPDWQERWLRLIHPDDQPMVADAAAAALRGGPRYDVEYHVVRRDGTVRIVHSQGDVRWDAASGQPLRQFGILQDITELRRAEQELRSSEARFRTFVDHATDSFFLLDDHAIIIDVNREAGESLGYGRNELIGMRQSEFDPALDEGSMLRLKQRMAHGETITFEADHRRKDGTVFPVEIRARQFEQGGRRFLALVRDITERKRAEQRQFASHEVSRILAEAVSVEEAAPMILQTLCECLGWDLGAMWRIDEQAGVLRCAELWCMPSVEAFDFAAVTRASAFPPGRGLPGRVWASHAAEFIPDAGRDPSFLRASAAATEGLHTVFAFPILLGTEVLGVVDLVSCKIWVPDRELLELMETIGGQIGQFVERKRAESALRQSEERFRTLVNFSFDVYWESDAQHRFTRQEFADGLADAPAPSSEIGKTRWEVPYLEPGEEEWRKHRERLDAHLPFRDFELARPMADGSRRYVSVSGLPVFDADGHFVGYRGVGRHITERKRAEEYLRAMQTELAHANRITAMGQLTASISHEVAQPVAASITNANAASRWLTADPPNLKEARAALDRILRNGRRASEIIGRIRALARREAPPRDSFDFNEMIREVLSLTQAELSRDGISLRTRLADGLPMAVGDRIQLQQVVLNLILNAREAMAGGPREQPPELVIITEPDAAGGLRFAVCDSGPGLSPENTSRLFEAFYTTKSGGMGMGLSICRTIVESHSGRIWAEPNEPRGAVFRFMLPSGQYAV